MISAAIGDVDLRFETHERLFSPQGLDAGTAAMLAAADIGPGDKVLDLGCGWGPVGVYAAALGAAVWMVDSDPLAVEYAARNLRLNGLEAAGLLQSDGFRGLDETGFTKILGNPPYHADFAVPKHMIEKGFNRLVIGGALWMVVKRDAWYRNKLTAIFGGVRARSADGYVVFEAMKKSQTYARR